MTEIAQTPPPAQPVEPKQSKAEKTLYNSSYFSIFARNFLSGFAKGLGALIVYVLFLGVITYFSFKLILPELKPILSTFSSIGQLTNGSTNIPQINPNQARDLLQQFQDQGGQLPSDTNTPNLTEPNLVP